MKNLYKLILLLLIIILGFSCAIPLYDDWWYLSETIEYENYADLENKILNTIQYENETKEFFKYPNETITDKYGDCEDRALLMLAIIYKKEGIKYDMIIGYGDNGNHAYITIKNKLYLNINLEYNRVNAYYFDNMEFIISTKRK